MVINGHYYHDDDDDNNTLCLRKKRGDELFMITLSTVNRF